MGWVVDLFLMRGKVRLWGVEGAILLLIGVLALLRVYLFVRVGHVLSPLDESVYIDYVLKVPTQGVVHQGEPLGREALMIQACHTWAQTDDLARACRLGDVSDLGIFPQSGITSADLYTPVYPTLTYWGMTTFYALGAGNELLAMRYTGAIWLALAAMSMWVVTRKMGVSPWACLGAALAIIGSTPVRWANNFVTPDATALLAGVAMAGIGLWWIKRVEAAKSIVPPAAAFALLGAFFTAIKLQSFFAVVAAGFWILLAAYGGKLRDSVPQVIGLGGGAVIAMLPQVLWVIYRAKTAVGPFPNQGVTEAFSFGFLVAETLRYLPGVAAGTGAPTLLSEPWGYWATQWMVISVGLGVLGTAIALSKHPRVQKLAIALLITMVIGGPALVVASSIAAHGFIPSPERYGLSMLPIMLIGAAAFFDQAKWSRYLWAWACAVCAVIWILIC